MIEAYLSGLEARAGGLSGIHRVASFFLSRVDVEVDRRLEELGSPSVPDLLYVAGLVAPDTVNTMTEGTIAAFLDHGTVGASLGRSTTAARETLASLHSLGLDLAEVSRTLEEQGVQLFIRAFADVLGSIRQKAGLTSSAA